jgi:hypothetical protein
LLRVRLGRQTHSPEDLEQMTSSSAVAIGLALRED